MGVKNFDNLLTGLTTNVIHPQFFIFHIQIISPMKFSLLFITLLFLNLAFLNKSTPSIIVNEANITQYLEIEISSKEKFLRKESKFWEAKLLRAPHQYPYKLKIADLQNQLFMVSGNVSNLNISTKFLEDAISQTNVRYSSMLRPLARNYITQHRFRDALSVLSTAEYAGEKLIETQKMLFDVHMELGNYELAGCYLAEISDATDFDYFIRMAKWQDFLGELDHAIHFMELAVDQAERMDNDDLKVWSYTNLGDFYGHAGNIKEAYLLYHKTLEIDNENVYALKQMAWIAFSYERDTDKALKIVESIGKRSNAPDLLLMKADIMEYAGNLKSAENLRKEFTTLVLHPEYGRMYNANLIELMNDQADFKNAIELSKKEVNYRPTPEIYSLLANSYFNEGNIDSAFSILKNKVVGHTSEPIPMYIAAEVYKQKGDLDFVKRIKKDLIASIFELGPLMEQKIENL